MNSMSQLIRRNIKIGVWSCCHTLPVRVITPTAQYLTELPNQCHTQQYVRMIISMRRLATVNSGRPTRALPEPAIDIRACCPTSLIARRVRTAQQTLITLTTD
ncbi:unnamed protein product [Arctia plantaginis]|uniref:Uncharacterized protein n=1 Tax=Arctia plantaginis TaxID=874455 RepID=A0A8S1ATT8_ARCPL|nr:unnamed protein product [Arctia plantaginis]